MSILERFFGGKTTVVTAAIVRADIERCEREIESLQTSVDNKMAGLATMTDSEHIAAEAEIAGLKRAIARFDARVVHLSGELPKIIANEEVVAKLAADEALRQRAEAARKANTKEGAKLLNEYDKLAGPMAEILARFVAMADETNAVNAELLLNPVAEPVPLCDTVHRKQPDVKASERTEQRPCWIYKFPASPAGTEKLQFLREAAREEVRQATLDSHGKPIPMPPARHSYGNRTLIIQPTLENREIVVERTTEWKGLYEAPLSQISLPPAFAGGKRHWPR